MDSARLALHAMLQAALPNFKLYFRPPSKIILEYPCAVYDLRKSGGLYADSQLYSDGFMFQIVVMTNIPGFTGHADILALTGASHETSYMSDDIVHDVFTIRTQITT